MCFNYTTVYTRHMKQSIQWIKLVTAMMLWLLFVLTKHMLSFAPESITIDVFTFQKQTLIQTVFVILIAYSFNTLLKVFIWQYAIVRIFKGHTPRLLMQIASIFVYFIATLYIVDVIFDHSVVAFLATFGAIGLVVGLGLQRPVLDVFAGISIHIDTPFRLGDYIEVILQRTHYVGTVTSIRWRDTSLITLEHETIHIPNSLLITQPMKNYSQPEAGVEFNKSFYFEFQTNETKVYKIFQDTLSSLEAMGHILTHPKYSITIKEITQDYIKYNISYMSTFSKHHPAHVSNALNTTLLKHLRAHNITPSSPSKHGIVLFRAEPPTAEWKLHLFESVPFFASLSQKELESLTNKAKRHEFKKSEIIVEIGNTDSSLFIIKEGFVSIRIPDENKHLTPIATLHPGDFFGEMALLTGEKRKATVQSETTTIAYEITKDNIETILNKNPKLFDTFASVMAQRAEAMNHEKNKIKQTKNKNTNLALVYLNKIKTFFSS